MPSTERPKDKGSFKRRITETLDSFKKKYHINEDCSNELYMLIDKL